MLLWYPKVYYCVDKGLPLDFVLRQFDPARNFIPYFFKIYLILSPDGHMSPKLSLSLWFSNRNYAFNMSRPSHTPLLNHLIIWGDEQANKFRSSLLFASDTNPSVATFEAFKAVKIQVDFSWFVTPCGVVVGQTRFRGPCCHLQCSVGCVFSLSARSDRSGRCSNCSGPWEPQFRYSTPPKLIPFRRGLGFPPAQQILVSSGGSYHQFSHRSASSMAAGSLISRFLLSSGIYHPPALQAYIYANFPIVSHFILKMEVAWTSEISLSYHDTRRRHNPGDLDLRGLILVTSCDLDPTKIRMSWHVETFSIRL
jgi:hypothetical protein